MAANPQENVTTLLNEIRAGSTDAPNQLFEVIRAEFYRLATQAMAGQRKDHTLQPTALLHEAWIRLFRANELDHDRQAECEGFLDGASRRSGPLRAEPDLARRRPAQRPGRSETSRSS